MKVCTNRHNTPKYPPLVPSLSSGKQSRQEHIYIQRRTLRVRRRVREWEKESEECKKNLVLWKWIDSTRRGGENVLKEGVSWSEEKKKEKVGSEQVALEKLMAQGSWSSHFLISSTYCTPKKKKRFNQSNRYHWCFVQDPEREKENERWKEEQNNSKNSQTFTDCHISLSSHPVLSPPFGDTILCFYSYTSI